MRPIDQVRAMLKDLIGGPDTPFLARRKQAEDFAAAFVKPPGIEINAGELDGVVVEWVVPHGAHATRIFFHLHGGGYVLGNPAGSRAFTSAPSVPATRVSPLELKRTTASGRPSVTRV